MVSIGDESRIDDTAPDWGTVVRMQNILDQLVKHDTGNTITMCGEGYRWDEMWRKTERAAGWIHTHGGVLACLMENTADAAACAVGALLCGGRAVSLPLPHRGQDINEYITRTADLARAVGAEYVACTDEVKALLGIVELPDDMSFVSFADVTGYTGATHVGEGGELIQFTSGSTGAPKGIPLDGYRIGANVSSIRDSIGFTTAGSVVSWLPHSHDMGFVGVLLSTWSVGGTGLISSPEEFVTRPLSWIENLSRTRSEITVAPNFALELVLRSWARVRATKYDLSGLKTMIIGGEIVRAETLRSFSASLIEYGMNPNVIAPAYGMAEVGLAVSLGEVLKPWRVVGIDAESIADGAPRVVAEAVSGQLHRVAGPGIVEAVVCGEVLPGYSVHCDPHSTLVVDGPSLFSGYLGGEPRQGAHRTQDTGMVLPDGGVVVLGRSDDVIVVRGRNIHPEDIENACQDAARRGVVAAVPDGSGGVAIVAEALSGEKAEQAATIRRLASHASGVAPSRVVFVRRGTLEKTTSGKIRRRSIAARLTSGTLDVASDHNYRS
jgi:acyl-CoA synthetase (AMP-forming)/AMP-acid ligase II